MWVDFQTNKLWKLWVSLKKAPYRSEAETQKKDP